MAQLLKMTQFVDDHGVPQVQIRGGRIHAQLYPQGPAGFEFLDQFCLNQQFVAAAPNQFKLFCRRFHRTIPE